MKEEHPNSGERSYMVKVFGLLGVLLFLAVGCTVTKVPGLISRTSMFQKQIIGELQFTVTTNGVTNIFIKSYNSDVSEQLGVVAEKVATGVVNGMKSSGS